MNHAGDGVLAETKVVRVPKVRAFETTPISALEAVGRGRTVVAGDRHLCHVTMVVGAVVVDVAFAESACSQRGHQDLLEGALSVQEFVRTVGTIVPTVFEVPLHDLTVSIRTEVVGVQVDVDVAHPKRALIGPVGAILGSVVHVPRAHAFTGCIASEVRLTVHFVGPIATIVLAVADPPRVVGLDDVAVVAGERHLAVAVVFRATKVEFLADLLDGFAELVLEGAAEFFGRVFGEGFADLGEHRAQHQEHDGVRRAAVAGHDVDARAAFFDDDARIGIATEAEAFAVVIRTIVVAQEVVHVGLEGAARTDLVGNRKVEQARIQTEVFGGHVGQVDAETGGHRVVAFHHAALDADVGLRAAGGDGGVIFARRVHGFVGGERRKDRRFVAKAPLRARRWNVEVERGPEGHGETEVFTAAFNANVHHVLHRDLRGQGEIHVHAVEVVVVVEVLNHVDVHGHGVLRVHAQVAVKACWVSA